MTNEQFINELGRSPAELAQEQLSAFVQNPGLSEMAVLFGTAELPIREDEKLAALHRLAARYWNYRKGAERQATNWSDELLDQPGSSQWNTIFCAADKLGLMQDMEPVNKHPDYLVILGGANRAPLDRLNYGLEKLEDFGHAVYLGSKRLLSKAEKEKSKDYAPGAETEFDLGCGAIETLLRARLVDKYKFGRHDNTWQVCMYEFMRDGQLNHSFALSTPRLIGGKKRATTYDNYAFFAELAGLSSNPNQTIVAVTTGLYTASQQLRAVRELTLNHGTPVETIGHSAEYSGATRKPSQLLQETKSAIDAGVRLERAIAASHRI